MSTIFEQARADLAQARREAFDALQSVRNTYASDSRINASHIVNSERLSQKVVCVCGSTLLALMLSSCGGSSSQSLSEATQLEVHIARNGELNDGLPFRYESLDATRLDELQQRENLDAVVATEHDEFQRMLSLKEWVAAQWPAGVPAPYPPWDAIEILDWIRSGRTSGHCGQYSQVLLQSLAALGFTARYVEIGGVDNPMQHFVVEVWSNQYDKWVLLDADYNVHFELNGVPLNALEIHDALLSSNAAAIDVVKGAYRVGHATPDSWPLRMVELFYYVRVFLKADHLSVPSENPFDRYNDMVEWDDEKTVMWEDSEVESIFPKSRMTNLRTSDRAVFLSKLNQVSVVFAFTEGHEIVLRFENNVHEFVRYQLREIGPSHIASSWQDFDGRIFVWEPSTLPAQLEVRGVNVRGVSGPASLIETTLKVLH